MVASDATQLSMFHHIAKQLNEINQLFWTQCNEAFYSRNLLIFVMSWVFVPSKPFHFQSMKEAHSTKGRFGLLENIALIQKQAYYKQKF